MGLSMWIWGGSDGLRNLLGGTVQNAWRNTV
jgi:hypothetical protein